MFNHGAIIGQKVVTDSGNEPLGTVTNSYHEGQTHWLEIDQSYELAVQSCELVLDLENGSSIVRAKGF
jgi:ribosomal 30S subunit maturation factor RimM